MSDIPQEMRVAHVADIYRAIRDPRRPDEVTSIAVTKAIARFIARGETIEGVGICWVKISRYSLDREGLPDLPAAIEAMHACAWSSRTVHESYSEGTELRCLEPVVELAISLSPTVLATIRDWLVALRADDAKAYGKVPKMNFAAMWTNQAKWHASLLKRRSDTQLEVLLTCPVIHTYPDGWSWSWVKTNAHRDAEGSIMGHCVGGGAYDSLHKDGGAIISLRDPKGYPHVTLQIDRMKRVQAQGRGNARPIEKYQLLIADAVDHVGAGFVLSGKVVWAADSDISWAKAKDIASRVRSDRKEEARDERHRIRAAVEMAVERNRIKSLPPAEAIAAANIRSPTQSRRYG